MNDKPDNNGPEEQRDKPCKNNRRGEISLADLVIVASDLPWKNRQHLIQMAHSLGFSIKQNEFEPDPDKPKVIYDHHYYDQKARPKKRKKEPRIPLTAPPPPELPVTLSDHAQQLPSELKPRQNNEQIDNTPPDWLGNHADFPSLLSEQLQARQNTFKSEAPLARINLFPDNTSRGTLSASLATQRNGFDPDIGQIILQIIRGQMLHQIPYKTTTTLDQGCQLLLDYNDTMAPYWPDLNQLATQIKNVVGSERVELYEFNNHPLNAKRWIARKKHKTWEPEAARPVLVATNLGQAPNGDQSDEFSLIDDLAMLDTQHEWRQLIRQCEDNHSPLLILTPWRKEALPTNLGNYPVIIHWNPKTSASMVRQMIGKGFKV